MGYFVKPRVERLLLADGFRRMHQALLDQTTPKATDTELATAQRRIDAAVRDGAWIEVKRELNAKEGRRVQKAQIEGNAFVQGEKIRFDPEQVGFAKVAEYLGLLDNQPIGWSLTDEGQPVPLTIGALDNLNLETYRAIAAAIDAHEEKVAAEKNAGSETTSAPISPSLA